MSLTAAADPASDARPPAPRFGLFLNQGGKSVARVLEEFDLAEGLGFDNAWVADHLLDTNGAPDSPYPEAWTLLAAIAVRTSRIGIGTLVSSATFRHPALLLKQAVTVDHLSGGRLTLGIGAGWHADEHRRFGIELPDPRERVDRLEETLAVVTRLMTGERTTYGGRLHRLEDAPFEPRPVHGRIPILIAAHRPRMISLAARYADQWDTFSARAGTSSDGVTESLPDRVIRFEAACRAVGRDPAALRRSVWSPADVLADESTYRRFVLEHAALGFTDFTTSVPPAGQDHLVRALAADVIPALRRELAGAAAAPGY